MRKIIISTFLTLDGVMQAPGGSKEDTSEGFEYGGWSASYRDEISGKIMQQQMKPADLLLGRKTYQMFASYWPEHADFWPGINDVTKYVLSNTVTSSNWNNTVFLTSLEDIKKLKQSEGGNLIVWGSSKLAQLLLKHDLVDELWLKIYPVILGKGKKLFAEDAMPVSLTLTESAVTSTGIFMATYKRAREVKTGTMEV